MSSNTFDVGYPDLLVGRYNVQTWKLVVHALKSYVIDREQQLRTDNVGDREWQELSDLNDIITDIELYILPYDDWFQLQPVTYQAQIENNW